MNQEPSHPPSDAELRKKLSEASNALLDLHLALMEAVKAGYEKVNGPIAGPGAMLHLLLNDPAFAWLRPISGMMAKLDEWTDDKKTPLDQAQVALALRQVEVWTSESPCGDATNDSYRVYLGNDHAVTMAHAVLRIKLKALPKP